MNNIAYPNIHDSIMIISKNLPTNKYPNEDKMDRANDLIHSDYRFDKNS